MYSASLIRVKPGGLETRYRRAATIGVVSVEHYENFPVASWLCPPRLRPAVAAIYWFARTADDIADEGDASAEARLADLAAYRADLDATAAGTRASLRWPGVFVPLGAAMQRHALPVAPMRDLLSAFTQDVSQTRYADRAELLDYCRRSANPVGRLLLNLYGIAEEVSLRRSDAICTALQLANFWQDLSVDIPRGRLYVPLDDCRAASVDPALVLAQRDDTSTRALVMHLVDWARVLMHSGAPLVHDVPGRAGLELRLVVQGGLRILDRIEALQFATLRQRPRVGALDVPLLAWRALQMRPIPNAALPHRSA